MRRLGLLIVLLLGLVTPAIAQTSFDQWKTNTAYPFGAVVLYDGNGFVCGCRPGLACAPPVCPINQSPATILSPYQWIGLSGAVEWRTGLTNGFAGASVMRGGNIWYLKTDGGLSIDPLVNTGGVYTTGGIPTTSPAIMPVGNTGVAIQAAIDAAETAGEGGLVQLACIPYTITSSINIHKALTLVGCNYGGTQFNVSPGVTAIDYTPSLSESPLHVSHIRFNGGAIGIQHNGGINSSVSECKFTDVTTAAVQFNGAASRWTAYHNEFGGSGTYAIQIASSTDNVEASIHGNLFGMASGATSSIESNGSGDLRILDNKFVGCAAAEIHLLNSGIPTSELIVVGNVVSAHGTGHYGLLIDPASSLSGFAITGNQFNDSEGLPGCPGAIVASIRVAGGQAGNMTISGNQFSDRGTTATIDLATGDHVTIASNNFVGNALGIGILVGGPVTNTLIAANKFTGHGTNISGTGGSGTQIGVSSATCSNGIVISGTGC